MQYQSVRSLLLWVRVLLVAAVASRGMLRAQDDGDPAFLFGSGNLTPPEGAANQEASGSVHLLKMGDRNAVHIRVRHLEPGATYDVRAAKGDANESIGSITTHDGTPPPPRCFKAKLTAPEAGETAPHGYALFNLSRDGTQLWYWIAVRGLEGIASATLHIGDAAIELEADGKGSVAVSAEQLAALALGQGSVTVVGSGDAPATISGKLEICFEELREELASRKAGRGALRIDTSRGDKLPLGAQTVADLVGVTFSVVAGGGETVLKGSVAELLEGGFHRPPGDGQPGADEPCEANLARPDPAPDSDALGEVEIEGEELEVELWRLARYTVYDVFLIEPGAGGGAAAIGKVKTGWFGAANHEFVAREGVTLPFGKTKISEFLGYGVEVRNAEGVVVLKGAIPQTACPPEAEHTIVRTGGGGGLSDDGTDSYFQLDEVHDASFIRGDANDDGGVNLADVVSILLYLFDGGMAPYCTDPSDVNDNGRVELSDPIRLLQHLFLDQGVVAAPYPLRGFDGTPDGFSCAPYSR